MQTPMTSVYRLHFYLESILFFCVSYPELALMGLAFFIGRRQPMSQMAPLSDFKAKLSNRFRFFYSITNCMGNHNSVTLLSCL